jgi:hypothetical protein
MRWLSVVGVFRTGIAVCFVLVALVFSGAASATGCGGSGAPAPNKSGNNVLTAVAATSACNAWAVGSAANTMFLESQTLIERWNGTAWKVQKSLSPDTLNELNGAAALSPSDAWAVGFDSNNVNTDQTLVEHWNGTAWEVQTSRNPSPTGFNELNGVAAVSSGSAWAVGRSSNGTGGWNTLIEHWNGTAWKVQKSLNPSASDNELYGVTALSASNAWAVGYYKNGSGVLQTLVEHWNGTAWKVQTSLNPSTTDNELKGVAAVSASNAWAVGSYKNGSGVSQTLVEHWNGTAWKVQKSPSPSTTDNELKGAAAVSSSDVWAVGTYDKGTLGRTLVERWNGTAWKG